MWSRTGSPATPINHSRPQAVALVGITTGPICSIATSSRCPTSGSTPGTLRGTLRSTCQAAGHRLLAIPSRERLERVLRYLLDESEFLSPYGIRALSRFHRDRPFVLHADGQEHRVDYTPGESTSGLFGGNSNWRGPIWFPVNYLVIEALERYHHFYGDHLRVECPAGSGQHMNLLEASQELRRRLARLFLPDESGRRACHGADPRYAIDAHWRDLPLFYEYFHGDTGRGVGASHQTGWTALVSTILRDLRSESRGNSQGQAMEMLSVLPDSDVKSKDKSALSHIHI